MSRINELISEIIRYVRDFCILYEKLSKLEAILDELKIPFDIKDVKPFYVAHHTLTLAFVNGRIFVIKDENGNIARIMFKDLTVNEVLALLKSERLTGFLYIVVERLKTEGQKIYEAVEILEKILQAIKL